MENTSKEIQRLQAKAEASLSKTAQLKQVLAQIEATLSRKENQKVTAKSKKT
tara:strand:+ start:2752 stop:2907 length:156 start_codon:yes stop_codon:yes gene_type:complete